MLENITKSCEYVIRNSKHVQINFNKLQQLAYNIKDIKMEHWLSSNPFGLLDLPVDTIINFLLIYDAIDFSFWGDPKWMIDTPEGSLDGGIALLYALLTYVKKNNTTDFSSITESEFGNILKGNVSIPLLHERLEIVREISNTVNKEMSGNFYEFIKPITDGSHLFDTILKYFPSFKDERIFNGKTIYFYKLANLLASDILHIREAKEGIETDYKALVGCADYKIPQVLRSMGILIYDEELAYFVDNKIEIETNSIYEIEIRANMIVVIETLYKLLDKKYSRMDINDYLFMRKKDKSLNFKPYHLTRCKDY